MLRFKLEGFSSLPSSAITWGARQIQIFNPAFLENICFKLHEKFSVVSEYIALSANPTFTANKRKYFEISLQYDWSLE